MAPFELFSNAVVLARLTGTIKVAGWITGTLQQAAEHSAAFAAFALSRRLLEHLVQK